MPISCELFDYIEIACMHRLELKVYFKEAKPVQGNAITTKVDAGKEILVLRSEGKNVSVMLDSVKELKAITPNPYFENIQL